jgi:hypothetical protein
MPWRRATIKGHNLWPTLLLIYFAFFLDLCIGHAILMNVATAGRGQGPSDFILTRPFDTGHAA